MKRRDFLKATSAASAWAGAPRVQLPDSAASERDTWIALMPQLADPLLTHLANATLKAVMPVEQAAGADRRSVTHLEALGRLIAGLGPWIEVGAEPPEEGRCALRAARL